MRPFIPNRDDLRRTVRLAAPVAFVQVGMTAMGLVDVVMVGHLSGTALAAVALGNIYFFGAIIFGMGVILGLDPIIAQAVGARDDVGVSRGLQRGLLLAVALTIPATALMLPTEIVLRWFGQPAELVPTAALFVWISIPGILPFLAFFVLRQTLQAQHRMKPIVYTIIIANLLNAALDWVLIFGHLGFPAAGVAGSAWATAVSRWAMALLMLGAGWSGLGKYLHPLQPRIFDLAPIRRMLFLGAPIGVQLQIEYGAFAFIGLLMGWLGTEQLAGHQVALNLASFTFNVPLGVSAAAAVLVGNAIGRHDPDGARRHAGAALVCGSAFMILSAITFIAIPAQLAAIYTTEGRILALAASLIPIAGIFQVFDGLQVVAGGILRGAGDTRIPMVINVLAFWVVMMPFCLFLGFRTSLGAVGLWWGLVAGLGAVAILLLLRIRHRFGRELQRAIIDEERAPSVLATEVE